MSRNPCNDVAPSLQNVSKFIQVITVFRADSLAPLPKMKFSPGIISHDRPMHTNTAKDRESLRNIPSLVGSSLHARDSSRTPPSDPRRTPSIRHTDRSSSGHYGSLWEKSLCSLAGCVQCGLGISRSEDVAEWPDNSHKWSYSVPAVYIVIILIYCTLCECFEATWTKEMIGLEGPITEYSKKFGRRYIYVIGRKERGRRIKAKEPKLNYVYD